MTEMESCSEVELPPSVQNLIDRICAEKCVSPPDVMARLLLSKLTEAAAVDILNTIHRSYTVRTFSGFIVHLIKNQNQNQNSPPLPLKRSLPTSLDSGTGTLECIRHVSSSSTQCALSPGSSFKSTTIPESRTPNDSYGSLLSNSNQTTSFSCLDLNNANSNAMTCHPGESIKSSFHIQKQLKFSPGCNTDDRRHSSLRQHLFDSSKVSHHFSAVQNQPMLVPCSSSKDTSPKHFSNFSSATHNDSPIQLQHTLSPPESLGGATRGDIESDFCSTTPIRSDGTHSVARSRQALHTTAPSSSSKNTSSTFTNFSGSTQKDSQIQLQHTLPPSEGLGGATHGNIEPRIGPMTPIHSDGTRRYPISDQTFQLAELEFRKMFMVYSYVGRNKLEDVIPVEDAIEIKKSMKNMPMFNFEAEIWKKYGRRCCEPSDRAMHYDWDSGKTYLYYCYVSAEGTCQFKGPYLNTRRTHLQRELGDDNVLIVQFIDDQETSDMPSNHCNWSAAYQRIAGGISIGLHQYRLFAFKDGRADNKNSTKKSRSSWAVKCYFIRNGSRAPWMETDSCILLKKTIHEARCLFMHVHTVYSMAKYISRCSLALSNTTKLQVDLASVHVERIEDIPCRDDNGDVVCNEAGEPLIHTDGTGFISEDLALLCAKDFIEAKGRKDENFEPIGLLKLEEESQGLKSKEFSMEEPPLLVQCRLFKEGYAVKGTLLVNKKLKARTIQVRPSMIKVEKDTSLSDSPSFSSLEINSISRRPRKANLSKNLIALLTVGGVPEDYFFSLLNKALDDSQKVSTLMRASVRVGLNYGQMDDSSTSVAMIGSGIQLDEPYLQYRLSILANEERKGLRGGKIPTNESFYLIGTADPTGTLNSDEVCVILENGQISGRVLVYRNPGIHFGDIHILNAKCVEELKEFVGNAKYGIFFSTKGRRSVGSEIANGDFDGDLYWISQSPQLLQYFKAHKPWERIHSTPSAPSKKPSELSYDELENEICTLLFATQKQNIVAGKAADSWLTFMDQYLTLGEDEADEKHRLEGKMLKLVDLYYDALDAPKSGKTVDIPTSLLPQKYPHFLEKKSKTFQSSSVLGKIYDKVKAYRPDNASVQEIWKLPIFNVEIPEASLNLWKDRYNSYKREMVEALQSGDESRNDSANMVIKRYKEMLYEAESFATSARKIDDIYNEALAIYRVSYDQAQQYGDVKKCGFAWRVAGEALCSFHAMKTPGKSISFKEDVLSKLV